MPRGVATEMGPEPVSVGTVVFKLVVVANVMLLTELLNLRLFLEGTVSKFVPVTVTAVDDVPILGVNPVIVGAPVEEVTVNTESLVSEPVGETIPIVPVVAPAGTVVVNFVVLADITVAETPLKVMAF